MKAILFIKKGITKHFNADILLSTIFSLHYGLSKVWKGRVLSREIYKKLISNQPCTKKHSPWQEDIRKCFNTTKQGEHYPIHHPLDLWTKQQKVLNGGYQQSAVEKKWYIPWRLRNWQDFWLQEFKKPLLSDFSQNVIVIIESGWSIFLYIGKLNIRPSKAGFAFLPVQTWMGLNFWTCLSQNSTLFLSSSFYRGYIDFDVTF